MSRGITPSFGPSNDPFFWFVLCRIRWVNWYFTAPIKYKMCEEGLQCSSVDQLSDTKTVEDQKLWDTGAVFRTVSVEWVGMGLPIMGNPWACRGLPAGPRCKWFSLPEGDRVVLCSSVSLSYSCVESFIQRRPSIEMIQGNNWLMTILMSIDVYLFSMHWCLLQLSLIFRSGQRYSSSCMSNQTVKRELIEV